MNDGHSMRALNNSSVFLPGSEETKQKEILAIVSQTKIPDPLSCFDELIRAVSASAEASCWSSTK